MGVRQDNVQLEVIWTFLHEKSVFTRDTIHQNEDMNLMDRPVFSELQKVGYKAHNEQIYEPI